jgi:hypothetical protein
LSGFGDVVLTEPGREVVGLWSDKKYEFWKAGRVGVDDVVLKRSTENKCDV